MNDERSSAEKRWATVYLADFAAQWVLRQKPVGARMAKSSSYALADEENSHARLLWVNAEASALGAKIGMRVQQARRLIESLSVFVLRPEELEQATLAITKLLLDTSPTVEAAHEHGVFFVDASGLLGLFPSYPVWVSYVLHLLEESGFVACVAVGFSRYGSYAAVKQMRRTQTTGAQVFEDQEEEVRYALHVPLIDLAWTRERIPPHKAAQHAATLLQLHRKLHDVGLRCLGDLRSISRTALQSRYGALAPLCVESWSLWIQWLAGAKLEETFSQETSTLPFDEIRATTLPEEFTCIDVFDEPENDLERLLFRIKPWLDQAQRFYAPQNRAVTRLTVRLCALNGEWQEEQIQPTEPASKTLVLLQLLRLRLAASPVNCQESAAWKPTGYTELAFACESVSAQKEQLGLPALAAKFSLSVLTSALDRVRARWGDVVMVARITDGHLPEAQSMFVPWVAADTNASVQHSLQPPSVVPLTISMFAMRRILQRPLSIQRSSLRTLAGPFPKQGGWWNRAIDREYYFCLAENDEIVWCFYDRRRRVMRVQGRIE